MSIWAFIGKILSASLMGLFFGATVLLTLTHFFPPASTLETQFSYVGIFGGGIAGLLGLFCGWRWALDMAEAALAKLVELLFLGIGALILGGIGWVVKSFQS